MEELIKTFHIDWKLLIAQMVNFTIVMAVLYYFGLNPLMKLMAKRSKKIEDGIKNAEIIEENLKKSEKQKQQAINQGRKKAQEIIIEAEKKTDQIRQEKIDKTKKEAEKIVTEAKMEIASERKKMIKEVKTELGELVLLASSKVAKATIDKKTHKKLINDAIAEIKKIKLD